MTINASNPVETGPIIVQLENLSRPVETVSLGDDRPREIGGQPVKYFKKTMLAVGKVHHKDKYGRDKVLECTPDFITDLTRHTNKWLSNGGKIRLPKTHKSTNPDDNCGWVREPLKFENGELVGVHQLIGEKSHELAARNDTSVSIVPNFKDSKTGEIYPFIIEHNAIVPDPVHSGLGDFVQLSASAGGAEEFAPVYTASTSNQEISMNADLRKRLLAHTGADETVADDILLSRAADELDKQTKDIGVLKEAAKSAKDSLIEVETERDELSRSVEESSTELSRVQAALSKKDRPAPSASEIYWANRAVTSQYDKMLRARKITPTAFSRAAARCLPKSIEPDAITLSREVQPDDYKFVDGCDKLLDLLEIMEGNEVAKLPPTGDVTALSREIPSPDLTRDPSPEVIQQWDREDTAMKDRLLAANGVK